MPQDDIPTHVPVEPVTETSPPVARNRVLAKMLERLFGTLVNGPSLNCRPHSSRQRIDLTQLIRLKDGPAEAALTDLLDGHHSVKYTAKVPPPPRRVLAALDEEPPATVAADHETPPGATPVPGTAPIPGSAPIPGTSVPGSPVEGSTAAETHDHHDKLTAEERAAVNAWRDQELVFAKLRTIAEDARTYEQDTGVHVLNIGFPLLSMPPNSFAARQGGLTRRIVAPIAFIPVAVTVKQGAGRSIELHASGEGIDLVVPNVALLAWLEQQTGVTVEEHFSDEKGDEPWREIRELVAYVAKAAGIDAAELLASFSGLLPAPPEPKSAAPPPAVAANGAQHETKSPAPVAPPLVLHPAPRTDQAGDRPMILSSAVLGLFPMANQGLLRDTQALLEGEAWDGPVEPFIRLGAALDAPKPLIAGEEPPPPPRGRIFADERLVAAADPCQSRAVRLARQSRALVVHGPPGTGKSQTITNIIGDHLARGERVLVVCDKRTALDVVYNRLDHMGLGRLCALVHDPQRDQRDLYKSIRQQLDELSEAITHPQADRKLKQIDEELQKLHGELTAHATALMARDARGHSFHDLVGEWFSQSTTPALAVDEAALKDVDLETLDAHAHDLGDLLERALKIAWPSNPWRGNVAIDLPPFLARPTAAWREVMAHCAGTAQATDATTDAAIPPFSPGTPLDIQATARMALADDLDKLFRQADPIVLRHWAAKDAEAARAAQITLDASPSQIDIFRQGPLDPAFLSAMKGKLPAESEAGQQHKTIREYAGAFALWARRFAAVCARSPGVRDSIVLHWLGAESVVVSRSLRRLDEAKPLADMVATGPLDRQMFLQFQRQPFDISQILRWTNLLNEYVETAGKFLGFLKPGPKNAAKPVAQYFGLALSSATAAQMLDFLRGLRARLELKADMESGVLPEPLPSLPADDELLLAYHRNRDTLKAVSEITTQLPSEIEPAAHVPVEAIHRLMPDRFTAASSIFERYGVPPSLGEANRLTTFLAGLHARLHLIALHNTYDFAPLSTGAPAEPPETKPALVDDASLENSLASHAAFFEFRLKFTANTVLSSLTSALATALSDPPLLGPTFIGGLRKSPARAAAILRLQAALMAAGLIHKDWLAAADLKLRAGELLAAPAQAMADQVADVESIIRIDKALSTLPPALRHAVAALMKQSAEVAHGNSILRRAVLSAEIGRRLAADPNLQGVDGQRIKTSFERYRQLDEQKKEKVRHAILHLWISRQQERLLATTGSRLNALGAELRRRLTLRGERAMRLRQVVAVGRQTEGGDPLLDICPVWLASPETVAQVFPREPLFDVVVFDEASQCRLEEALPVLTRARRVVIAGDPQQLPPTRFFESAIAASEDEEIETDQQLFEAQQGEIEDLLAAALNLAIQECYLDVHYRSRNSSLIEFSNEYFYSSRLQAIPGHPSRRARFAPLTLYRADGIYDKRRNDAEASQVVKIVRDLLKRAQPPSIGIACFNLPQRDLIVEKLEELAEEDGDFARRLTTARARQGEGSFEGLFVKNLENVQGDERDHIIISTTYGPDAKGRFHRRFGPVGRQGGGRRLNVLVTRARDEVHLITSIPAEAYRHLPEVPAGQAPGGAFLLFAYLQYAERLAGIYETAHLEAAATEAAHLDQARLPPTPQVNVRASRTPSAFAAALAHRLATDHQIGSDVHWGNDGFCIDLALHDRELPEQVTIGVLCDASRFNRTEDPVEWDVFRTGVLEDQGWQLHRLWTPHFYRDVDGRLQAVVEAATNARRGK